MAGRSQRRRELQSRVAPDERAGATLLRRGIRGRVWDVSVGALWTLLRGSDRERDGGGANREKCGACGGRALSAPLVGNGRAGRIGEGRPHGGDAAIARDAIASRRVEDRAR